MALSHARPYHFNSRPHEEVDYIPCQVSYAWFYFNSRPHEEVDIILKPCCESVKYFNSRPHEEVDSGPLLRQYHRYHFNSRPHEEVDQWLTMHSVSRLTFQLTTSRGGRQYKSVTKTTKSVISTHDLTRRSTFRSMSSRSY